MCIIVQIPKSLSGSMKGSSTLIKSRIKQSLRHHKGILTLVYFALAWKPLYGKKVFYTNLKINCSLVVRVHQWFLNNATSAKNEK